MEWKGGTIKVVLADDQNIFRQGLTNLINGFDHMEVLLAAENGLELFNRLDELRPDIVLLDFRMPVLNGIETTKKIRSMYPSMRILILSMYDDEEFVESAIENGANGYLSKDDDANEIAQAIYSTVETGYYLNDRTSKHLVAKMMQQGKMKPIFQAPTIEFNEHELLILKLICAEFTTAEIADKICKSIRTIESARTSMMHKIGARNVVGLVMYAVKNNLL